jgi:RNA polymerase sigma-70 factor (ECF subfamily)
MREMIVPGVSAMPPVRDVPANPRPLSARDLGQDLEAHRRELTAYAYRMLGSTFEAEDAVQETLLRAWRGYGRFEGRAGLRSWLYRIATNVCLDALEGRKRRVRPMDLGAAGVADISLLGEPLPEATWVEPVPDERILVAGGDPAEVAIARESVRLAFVTALQRLPPRQRAVLILREVLHWQASEVAELLETSVASVNSALQRASATLQAAHVDPSAAAVPLDPAQQALLERYVEAFESYDMDRLTALLREDAVWNMPPYALWLRTHADITTWCLGPGIGCRGSKLVPTMANASPAFGQYKPSPSGGPEPWSLQVLELSGDRISAVTFFLDTARLFPLFGLPDRLPPEAETIPRVRPDGRAEGDGATDEFRAVEPSLLQRANQMDDGNDV